MFAITACICKVASLSLITTMYFSVNFYAGLIRPENNSQPPLNCPGSGGNLIDDIFRGWFSDGKIP